MSYIPKDKITKKKGKLFLKIEVVEYRKKVFGNSHFIVVSSNKEEREDDGYNPTIGKLKEHVQVEVKPTEYDLLDLPF